jgi:polar amino acid transport system substrate-binding protein
MAAKVLKILCAKRTNKMKKMKKIISLLFALILASSIIQAATLSVATVPLPPFQIDSTTGVDVEVTGTVLKNIGYDSEIQIMSWSRAINLAKQAKIDVLLGCYKTPDRDAALYFSQEPSSVSRIDLCYRKGADFEYSGIDSLTGKKIGILRDFSYGDAIDNATHLSLAVGNHLETNFKKLLSGQLDAVLVNRTVGAATAEKMGILDQLAYSDEPIHQENAYTVFARKPGYEELAGRYSTALIAFKQTDEYRAILKKYGF